jgi:hypothetical protein
MFATIQPIVATKSSLGAGDENRTRVLSLGSKAPLKVSMTKGSDQIQ